ncbi:MAG TPA: DJ-1/PfpI family protein [Pyrinomonadaceae bacterium]|jgi:transcriptional regulator GlxA family with amidase domain
MKVSIVTFDDFTDLDLFILWDILNRAGEPGWRVMMLGDAPAHTSSTGVEIKMHGPLAEANSSDAVLFCSGRGARAKFRDAAFLDAFRLDEGRQLLGAIDSGALLLGALGFLRGRKATTYPSEELQEALEGMGAEVVWRAFVREGNVATAAQCLAGQHLAGWVIETLAGPGQRERALASVAPLDSSGGPAGG